MIYSKEFCSEGGFSYDDIDLWSRLRSISLVKVRQGEARQGRAGQGRVRQGKV